ncbi:MAG: hypothetical protein MJZ83_03130, partial [Bacteroidaceae bacterium]|nr:hypothetical protein [Bacteroidaceae bacterium]
NFAAMENISREEFYVARLEEWCYSLKCAVIDISLKLPSESVFVRYLSKLEAEEDVVHVMSLLHECWTYIYPGNLFDQPSKSSIPDDIDLKNENYDVVKEEIDMPFNALTIEHYKEMLKKPGVVKFYQHFIQAIHAHSQKNCSRFDLVLLENFLIDYSIHTEVAKDKLRAVFDVIVYYGYLKTKDKNDFMAIFDYTINAWTKQLRWMDISGKNKEPAFASLYVVLKCLAGTDVATKRKACKCFVDANGDSISPDQLKTRDSKILAQFESELKAIID